MLFLGDKIVGINGVSIEGMPHEKAMELLRDDTRPLLNLRLSKNAMNMEKGMSLYSDVCFVVVTVIWNVKISRVIFLSLTTAF